MLPLRRLIPIKIIKNNEQQIKQSRKRTRMKKPPREPPRIPPRLAEEEGEEASAEEQESPSDETTPEQASHVLLAALKKEVEGQGLQLLLASLVPLQSTQELLSADKKYV